MCTQLQLLTCNMNLSDFKDAASSAEVLPLTTGLDASVRHEKQAVAKQSQFAQYAISGNSFITAPKTCSILPPNIYTPYCLDNGSVAFEPHHISSDEWLTFKDSVIEHVLKEINTFWSKTEVFKKYGFLQRRGYLLYGPPGTGKTVLVKQIMDRIIKNGGMVLKCDTSPTSVSRALKQINEIEPDRQIVCIYEDLDALIRCYGESDLLSLLDGEDSTDHILNIATTNYPEQLDRRIVGRPRRFDRLIKIGYPSKDMRSYFFINKLKLEPGEELNKWVNETEGFTFAALTELVVAVKCLENSFEDSVKTLKELLNNKPSSTEFSISKIGFK